MKRGIFFYFFLFLCIAVRADFTQTYLNTGRENSNPDYRKPSIWSSTANYPQAFLENRPVEISGFWVFESMIEVEETNDIEIVFVSDRNGDHKLNILGVDILDASGVVVRTDYHYGTDGGAYTTPVNNIYTLHDVSAGIYTMRCFTCGVVGTDVVKYAAGTISVTGAWKYIADGVYELHNRGNSGGRGCFVYSNQYPGEIKVAESALPGYTSSEYCFSNRYFTVLNCYWYLVTSKSGKRYMFNLHDGSFISKNGEYATLDAENPTPLTLQYSLSNPNYFLISRVVDGTFLTNCVTNGLSGEQACWSRGDDADGVIFEFVKINKSVNESVLLNANAVIDKAEQGISFEWNSSTEWNVVDESCYTSVVLNDCLSGGILCHDYDCVSVEAKKAVVMTFNYGGSGYDLNIRGVEAVDENGNIVAGDYHVGVAGENPENNIYVLKIADAGVYKLRLYVTCDEVNNLDETNGVVVLTFEGIDAEEFSYKMAFNAEYATLCLGYKVSIPEGIEAYVVNAAYASWVTLEKIEDVIPANTPVVLKNVGESSEYTFTYTDNIAPSVGVNLLCGSIVDRYVTENSYVLALENGALGFYLAKLDDGSFFNNANKAYLPVNLLSSSAQNIGVLRLGVPASVDAVECQRGDVKAVYDLRGRCVNEVVERGVYIVNGKKICVK